MTHIMSRGTKPSRVISTEATVEQELPRTVLPLSEGQCNNAVQDGCNGSSIKRLMELAFTGANSILLLEGREDWY